MSCITAMRRFDASSAECLVFTFKEGLLAAVAHDLKIRVTRFEIEVDERTKAIAARFASDSLRVVSAMTAGRATPGTLSTANRRQIEENIVRDVLDAHAHPEIRFVSSAVEAKPSQQYVVKGTLTLCARQRRIRVSVREEPGHYVAEARVHQPDFGITPYSAMLGTLKVKADVAVQVTVPTGDR